MRWLPSVLAFAVGLALHTLLLWGLDLRDLPGPGGVLLARDLLLGQHSQGPASWLVLPGVLLGPVPALRLLGAASLAAAMMGAGLAAAALAGRRAAPWAVVLTACWALVVHQALLVDAGGPAWGLSWLGLGLSWWACTCRRYGLVVLGALLLALGVATKASALPVVLLLPIGPWLRSLEGASERSGPGRLALVLALLVGLALGAVLGWACQSAGQPWLAPQAVASQGGGWLLAVLSLGERGAVHGSFPLLLGLAALGTVLFARRQPMVLVVLALSLLTLAVVGEARAERLQPRHLLPASVGLVVLVAALGAWRRLRWAAPLVMGALCCLALLDGLAFAQAFSAQRERFALTEPSRLPGMPTVFAHRYPELPWAVLYESSLVGVAPLLDLPDEATTAVASPPYQERRDAHLEVASLQLGAAYRRLTEERCCTRDQDLQACASEVVQALDAAGALLVLPGKLEVVAQEDRAFAQALEQGLGVTTRRPARWRAILGTGSGGELPCRPGR